MDRINIFHRANRIRDEKFAVLDEYERHILNSKELELRRENKQIWDELAHYSKTGTFLGKHKSFLYENTLKEFSLYTPAELLKKYSNIPNYIYKAKKTLETVQCPNEISKIQSRINKREIELKVIRTLFNLKK